MSSPPNYIHNRYTSVPQVVIPEHRVRSKPKTKYLTLMNYPVNLYSSWSTLLPSPSLRPSVPGHNPSLKSFYTMFWNYEKAVFKELMV